MNTEQMLREMLEDAAERLELELEDVAQVAAFGAQRVDELAGAVGEPGFSEAVVAVRDEMALRLGMQTVDLAEAADREVMGMIAGLLRVVAIAATA